MRILELDKLFKGRRCFQLNKQKYIFLVYPNPVRNSNQRMKLGCYAINCKTEKCTSLEYMDLELFRKHPESELQGMKEKLIRQIKRRKI